MPSLAHYKVKHQHHKPYVTEEVNGAVLTAEEMRNGECTNCKEKFWPGDHVGAVEEPDQ